MALPKNVLELVRVLGHGRAMDLVREFGGQEIVIPASDASDTWAALAECIGEKGARKLCIHFMPGTRLYIAKCTAALRDDRNRQIIERYEALLRDGHTGTGAVSVLVRESRLSYRQLENIVNRPAPAPSEVVTQGALF